MIVMAKKVPEILSFLILFLKKGSNFKAKNPMPFTGWGNFFGSPNIKSMINPRIILPSNIKKYCNKMLSSKNLFKAIN